MAQQRQQVDLEIVKKEQLSYLLFLPEGYAQRQDWPLILFLHGAGERGSDLDLIKTQGLPRKLEHWSDCPFVVIAPQCPAESYWTFKLDALNALLDYALAQHAIDPDRVYLTGMSMGGLGTWLLSMMYPNRFAAIAPICARANRTTACRIKHLPIWMFHGAQDDIVPITESWKMLDALQACGAPNVRLTVYSDAGHDSWTATYDNLVLYNWFLQYRSG